MSQIDIVYRAYLDGSRTTGEVSALTGLSVKHCSAHTRELIRRGLIEQRGPAARESKFGRQPYFYQPVSRGGRK